MQDKTERRFLLTAVLAFVFAGLMAGKKPMIVAYADGDRGEIPLEFTQAETSFSSLDIEEGQKLAGITIAKGIHARREAWKERREQIRQMKEAVRTRESSSDGHEANANASSVIVCSSHDYEVLKRIVEAEAGICDLKGRILVANVIINRVKSREFPDSITDVVYQKHQFSPVSNGSLDSCTVTQDTIEAVNRALQGEDYSRGALYFMNRGGSEGGNVSWFDRSLTYLFRHERHEFFK